MMCAPALVEGEPYYLVDTNYKIIVCSKNGILTAYDTLPEKSEEEDLEIFKIEKEYRQVALDYKRAKTKKEKEKKLDEMIWLEKLAESMWNNRKGKS